MVPKKRTTKRVFKPGQRVSSFFGDREGETGFFHHYEGEENEIAVVEMQGVLQRIPVLYLMTVTERKGE